MEDFPENSSMQYNMLLPMSLYAEQFTKWGGNGNWKTMDEDLGNFLLTLLYKFKKMQIPKISLKN